MGQLWQIDTGHFCAGLVVRDGKVADAAPILRWTRGRSWVEIQRRFAHSGARIQPVR